MSVELSQYILRFKAQPRFVRVFVYILAAGFVLRVVGTLPDFYHGFSQGLADGLRHTGK